MNQDQDHEYPRLTNACGEQRLLHLFWSHRRACVDQISEKLNAGHDRKVSEHTVHPLLLYVWGHNGHVTTEQWKKFARSDESRFLLDQVDGWCWCQGKRWQQDALWEEGRLVEAVLCSGQFCRETTLQNHSGMVWERWQIVQDVALAIKFSRSPFNWASTGCAGPINLIHGGPPPNLQDLKALPLMSHNNVQRSCGVYASTHQSCFGSTRETYSIGWWFEWCGWS